MSRVQSVSIKLWGLLLLALMLLSSCASPIGKSEGTSATEPSPFPSMLQKSSLASAPSRTFEKRKRLAQRLAVALRDPAVRADLVAAFQRSNIREQKVELQHLLASRPELERKILGEGDGLSLARADLSGESYEVYMPIEQHRKLWDGDADILVAVQHDETAAPIAFSPDGQSLTLSLRVAPSTPVIMINVAEISFSAAAVSHSSALLESCDDNPTAITCGGGGGGGSAPPRPGLYIRALQLNETHEPWTNGAPELEVIPYFPVGILNPTTLSEQAGCAGQGGVGDRFFDINGTTWSGRAMLIPEDTLETYRQQFPARAFRINIHEDDSESCWYKNVALAEKGIIEAIDLSYSGITSGAKGLKTGETTFIFKAALSVAKLISMANANDDDLHGYLVPASEIWSQSPPNPSFNWAVVTLVSTPGGAGTAVVGWAHLEYIAP